MAGHPLRSATDRRFGGPLPRQLANQTRVHLTPPEFFTLYHAVLCAYAVLAVISNCCPPVQGRLPTRYSPVRHSVHTIFLPKDSVGMSSFDLHVLGTPPAFILSQDQTLMFKFVRSKSVWLILPFYCCFRFLFSEISLRTFFVLFGIFRVALLFICQGAVLLIGSISRRTFVPVVQTAY